MHVLKHRNRNELPGRGEAGVRIFRSGALKSASCALVTARRPLPLRKGPPELDPMRETQVSSGLLLYSDKRIALVRTSRVTETHKEQAGIAQGSSQPPTRVMPLTPASSLLPYKRLSQIPHPCQSVIKQ